MDMEEGEELFISSMSAIIIRNGMEVSQKSRCRSSIQSRYTPLGHIPKGFYNL